MKRNVLKVLASLVLVTVLSCSVGTISQAYVYPYPTGEYQYRNHKYEYCSPDYHFDEYEVWERWARNSDFGGVEVDWFVYDRNERVVEPHSYTIVDYNTRLVRCEECGDEYYIW